MARAAAWVFLVITGLQAFAQGASHPHSNRAPASPGWPFGPPRTRVGLQGLLAHADGEMLSIELSDQRVVRFRLTDRTHYKADAVSERLDTFHISDVVYVDSEVDGKGYLQAREVRFVRKASVAEQSEIVQCPEAMQRWHENLLQNVPMTPMADDRRLALVTKPQAVGDRPQDTAVNTTSSENAPRRHASEPDLIPLIRTKVQEAFDRLPNFRARQVTSMFHSVSKPIRWVPDGVVAGEIGYEDSAEFYTDVRVDGKRLERPADAVDSDYMRSLDKAWSTGDFETISHCVFSELSDSDFRKVGIEHAKDGDLALYSFHGQRSSTCIALKFKSEIAYPAYKGLMKVDAHTHAVVHLEMEATEIPAAFPIDRAERSVDLGRVRIGESEYRLPVTGYWFGCFQNSYSCFLNRMDFRDYRLFETESSIQFGK